MASLALPIIGGLAGLFSKPKTQTTTSSGSSTGSESSSGFGNTNSLLDLLSKLSGTSTGTTTSGYSTPEAQSLSDQLVKQFGGLAQSSVNLAPYEASQVSQINRNSQLLGKSQQEALAARGLSTSPIAGSVAANTEAGRVGQITNLQQSLPLLQQQMLAQNLNSAGGFLSTIPRTTSSTGTQEQTSTGQQTGNTFSSQSQQGNQSGTTNSTSTTNGSEGGGVGGALGGFGSVAAAQGGNTFGGLGKILAHLFG